MQGGQFDTADNLTPRTIWHHHKFYISTIVWPQNMIRNILISKESVYKVWKDLDGGKSCPLNFPLHPQSAKCVLRGGRQRQIIHISIWRCLFIQSECGESVTLNCWIWFEWRCQSHNTADEPRVKMSTWVRTENVTTTIEQMSTSIKNSIVFYSSVEVLCFIATNASNLISTGCV